MITVERNNPRLKNDFCKCFFISLFSANDLSTMIDDCKLLVMLAKVHRHANKMEDAMLALTKARDMQARYITFLNDEKFGFSADLRLS